MFSITIIWEDKTRYFHFKTKQQIEQFKEYTNQILFLS